MSYDTAKRQRRNSMMPGTNTFVLRTYFGTFIVWPDGETQGRHVDLRSTNEKFLELKTDNDLKTFTCDQLESTVVEVWGDHVVIRRHGKVLSAERNGTVTFSRDAVGDWEKLVPVRTDLVQRVAGGEFTRAIHRVPSLRRSDGIPRVIHQTYPTAKLPHMFVGNVTDIRSKNPEYQYILWTDKDIFDFIYNKFGYEMLSAYLSIHPHLGAARADLFRYLVCYAIGGIYLDIKSGLGRPLNQIVFPDDMFLLRQWGAVDQSKGVGIHPELSDVIGGEFQQWWIACQSGHPFLKAVIDLVLTNIACYVDGVHARGKHAILKMTGPIAYTRAIRPILSMHTHRLLDRDQIDFIYNVLGNPTDRLFPRHYSNLDVPIVLS